MNLFFAQMDPIAAPAQIKEWLECLFFFAAFVLVLAALVKVIRGKAPAPPNAVLGQSHGEIARRVDNLEVWKEKRAAQSADQREFEAHIAEDHKVHEQLFAKANAISRDTPKMIDRKFDDLRKELSSEIKSLAKTSDESQTKIHDRINDVLGGMREQVGTIGEMKTQISELREDVRDLKK